MKTRPILFNGAMVRALLSGQKTQTRRAVKPDPGPYWHPIIGCFSPTVIKYGGYEAPGPEVYGASDESFGVKCPYGQPGDRLYVRETFAQPTTLDPGPTIYRADYPGCVPDYYTNIPPADEVVWRPSIHMPKALSRITLEITDVRVERLHDITEADAIAEGCAGGHSSIPGYGYNAIPYEHFRHIWESTGGDWDANPWVWVVEFKRLTP